MISTFLQLEKKQYFRSSYWQKSIVINIFLGLFALYLILVFSGLGIGGFYILRKEFPTQDPLVLVNSFLLYAIIGDLMFRFLMQKLKILNVKPLLIVPIPKSKIIHYVLVKSVFSFFNFLGLFFYIPFAIVLVKEGYELPNALGWLLLMIFLVQSANFLNFLINKNNFAFVAMIGIIAIGTALQYFELFNVAAFVGEGFDFVYQNPLFCLLGLIFLVFLYILNFKNLSNQVYIDGVVSEVAKEVHSADLSWADKLGDLAPFIKNDIRLIWRNKRTKSSTWMLLMGLFYGLIFYPNPAYADKEFFFVFIGIFSTGIFLMNFGQFVPAWDSSYYNMLMTQNFKYERYLKSKFTLMSASVIILFILGIPYIYFGWKILIVHFASMIYNIGVNTHVILWGGSYNRKKINLDQKAAFNYQGTGAVQWLIGIPLMILPMALFGLLNWLVNFETAVSVIATLGLIGIILHKKIMGWITQKYIASKYIMIHSFKQEN